MAEENKPKRINLREVFLGLQAQMSTVLANCREVIRHPGAKGDASESEWKTMLNAYLPRRYSADKAFVIDCDGNISDQIDVVLYDRQYSPFLFNQNDAKYLPAESVYAVLEVRQAFSSGNIRYAGEKASSVRRLRRTSAPIRHAGGNFQPLDPPPILAGILALGSDWEPPLGRPLETALRSQTGTERIDLGCALDCGSFEIRGEEPEDFNLNISSPETALIFFFLRLLARLQAMGTVGAIDLTEYGRVL